MYKVLCFNQYRISIKNLYKKIMNYDKNSDTFSLQSKQK